MCVCFFFLEDWRLRLILRWLWLNSKSGTQMASPIHGGARELAESNYLRDNDNKNYHLNVWGVECLRLQGRLGAAKRGARAHTQETAGKLLSALNFSDRRLRLKPFPDELKVGLLRLLLWVRFWLASRLWVAFSQFVGAISAASKHQTAAVSDDVGLPEATENFVNHINLSFHTQWNGLRVVLLFVQL